MMKTLSMPSAKCVPLAVWMLISAAAAGAQCPPDTLQAVLDNPAPTAFDHFGISVAVSGGVAVAGAHYDDPGGVNAAGTAYVFDTTTGALIATLNNPAPSDNDWFGASVAVSGNVAVVGAYRDDPGGSHDAGRAWVFDATTGAIIATLNNPAPSGSDWFGASVAVSGNVAVVGAQHRDSGGMFNEGSAYVFNAATGALTAVLDNPAPAANDVFGSSVAVSGNVIVVGAYLDDPGGVGDAGSAYVYNAMTGALVTTLNNPSPAVDDRFGGSVAVSGNVAVVGAYLDDPGGLGNAGTAYVFDATTGALITTLNNPAPTATDYFGLSVAVSGNVAVVGSYLDDPGGLTDAGRVWVFDAMTGALTATISSPSPAAGDIFGRTVAVSGYTVVTGAPEDDPGGVSDAGTAYVFNCADLIPTPTPSPDPTATPSATQTSTPSPDPTATPTASRTPTPTPSPSPTATASATATPTPSPDPTATPTATETPTPSPDPTATPTATQTPTPTPSPDPTSSPTPTPPACLSQFGIIPISGAFQVPVNGSASVGVGEVFINTIANELNYTITLFLLEGDETAAGIHAPAAPGFTAPEVVSIPPGMFKTGTWNYPEALEADLLAGLAYINIATTTYPAGELRGQIFFDVTEPCPQPSPTPSPSPAPSPSPTLSPSAVPTPSSDATSTPTVNPSTTPSPQATVTPTPNATASPSPHATATHSPDATASPSPDPTTTPTAPPCCPGDADLSGSVNAQDFLAVQENFGLPVPPGGLGDADCSGGTVNAQDFLGVQDNFGLNCG